MFFMEHVQSGSVFYSIVSGICSAGVVGFLFWSWLNTKFSMIDNTNKENRARIIKIEENQHSFLAKDEYQEMRREERELIERQISEIKRDIKEMPKNIVDLLKPFINK